MQQIPLGVHVAQIHAHVRKTQILTLQSSTERKDEMLSRSFLRLLLMVCQSEEPINLLKENGSDGKGGDQSNSQGKAGRTGRDWEKVWMHENLWRFEDLLSSQDWGCRPVSSLHYFLLFLFLCHAPSNPPAHGSPSLRVLHLSSTMLLNIYSSPQTHRTSLCWFLTPFTEYYF